MSDAQKPETRTSDWCYSCNKGLEGYPTCMNCGALSQPTEEIRMERETYLRPPDVPPKPECLCEGWEEPNPACPRCGHLVRPKTPDVLPVLEGWVGGDHYTGRRIVCLRDQEKASALPYDTPVCAVPTEGYRVIREDSFRAALYKALADRLPEEIVDDMEDPGPQSLVGPLHDDILTLMAGGTPVRKEWTESRLTNTEDQP